MSLALFPTFCWVVPPPFNSNWLFAKYIQFQFHPFSLYARMSVCPSVWGYSVSHWLVCVAGWVHSFIHWNILVLLRRLRHSWMPSKPASVLMRCDNSALSERGKNFVRVFVFDAHWKVIHCWMLVGLLWIHIKIYCCQVCKWGGKYFRVPTLYMCNDLIDLERSAWNGTYDDGYGNAEYDRP